MVGSFRKIVNRLRRCASANTTILVAVGMPALIGGAGVAVDTAQWYLWKKELQHSVDQAALAGAWTLASDPDSGDYETRALQEFTSNRSVTLDFSSEPNIQLANYGSGTANSVVVTASATKMLVFSSFLTGKAANINVRAQAAFEQGNSYSACLKALKENGTGFNVGGNSTVKAQCGLAAMSCDENAISIDGSATIETQSIAACGTISAPEELDDVVVEGVQGMFDDYADLPTPQADNNTVKTLQCSGKGNKKYAYPTAGVYNNFVVSCDTTLGSGVYVIDGGTLDLTANADVTGNNVMFVLKNGANIKLGGHGNNNIMNLTPMQAADFVGTANAAWADRYQGILVFEDKNNKKNGSDITHIINGNANTVMEGSIYLPVNKLRVNGTANINSQCLLISAYEITVLGNAYLETLCPVDDSLSGGYIKGGVRLVA